MGLAESIADKLGELFALQEERTRSQIAAGLVETRNALRLLGARSVPLNSYAGTQSVWAGPGRLVGWSVRANGGPASLTFYDGRPDALGDVVAVLNLSGDGVASNHGAAGAGISITEACSVVVTGNVTGAVYLGAKD